MQQSITLYEVDVYLRKEYSRNTPPCTLRFENASNAYDYFMSRKNDPRVWQLFFRTISRTSYVDENGDWLAFTEETTRTTHWINPHVVCLS